jgi:BirA family biotin operon repressor/biotin-[acetyl-CoA-carboxylase] ligase
VRSGPARVLESLRRAGGRSCSGGSLSREQGVSRNQIWKDVEALRSLGYAIDAIPGDGYRLTQAPDRLYPEEIQAQLGTRWLGRDIHWHETTDSTNRVAQELARSGAAHGTAVIAEGQTAGRGRLGRSFFSPPYENLYVSIVLRPRLTTAQAPTWILAAAVAVADAIADSVPDPEAIEIKWPNDVLLGGLKASGILMELGAEATRVAHLVLGIGVNLNAARDDFPAEFRASATSLACHTGHRIDRIAFVCRLFERLEETLDRCAASGFESVRPTFEARFHMAGRRVRVVDVGGEHTEGVALGIDAEGALRLRLDDGGETRVIAGDVTLAKDGP